MAGKKYTDLGGSNWPVVGCLGFFVCIGVVLYLVGWRNIVLFVVYGLLGWIGLLIVVAPFAVVAHFVKKTDMLDGEEVKLTRKDEVKLKRLEARLTAHAAAASIKEELEDLQENPRPVGKPSYDKGGGTLPGAGGEGLW